MSNRTPQKRMLLLFHLILLIKPRRSNNLLLKILILLIRIGLALIINFLTSCLEEFGLFGLGCLRADEKGGCFLMASVKGLVGLAAGFV